MSNLRTFARRIPVDAFITLLGLAGLALFLSLYSAAFPSAALHITKSRAEITRLASAYMQKMGYEPAGYQFSLTFGQSSFASIFLQRTVGIQETNRLIQSENLPFWYWRARWFKPMQEEEFTVYLLPDGRIDGFSHTIPEAAAGARIDQAAARAIAETYLAGQGWDLSKWETVDASSTDQLNRRDHSFSWKRRDFNLADSQIRLTVDIQGDRVGYSDYWFKTPDAFARKFSEQRNLPSFINNTAYEVGLIGFSIIAIAFLLFPLLQRTNPLRGVLPLAALVAGVVLLSDVNALPLYKAYYGTTQNWTLFWTQVATSIGENAVSVFVFIAAILAGGRYISRQVWPRRDKILPRGADRWGILARSGWRGLMLGGVLLGYAVLFYWVTTRLLGGWSPMDVDYSNSMATPLPFLAPLSGGLLPAVQEETLFRLVGVSLIFWLTRKKWLALLIPGTLWAFAHLSYIRDPFYLRGIELLITAVFVEGLIFLSFDLTTTIVAHMTYNAILGALPMLRSSDPYLVFSGALVVLLLLSPAAFGWFRSWLSRRKGLPAVPQIRPAQPADLPQLAARPVTGLDWPLLLQNPCAAVLVLDASGQLVGVAAAEVDRLTAAGAEPSGSGEARLLAVSVDPPWRGQFWGSRLVDGLWLRLEPLGARSFDASVPGGSRSAYAFLSALGWQTTRQTLARQAGTLPGNWAREGAAALRAFIFRRKRA